MFRVIRVHPDPSYPPLIIRVGHEAEDFFYYWALMCACTARPRR